MLYDGGDSISPVTAEWDVTKKMNITQFISEDIDALRSLLYHEKMFLKFSYYSGFIIATFNFIIFIIAAILFAKVRIKTLLLLMKFKFGQILGNLVTHSNSNLWTSLVYIRFSLVA